MIFENEETSVLQQVLGKLHRDRTVLAACIITNRETFAENTLPLSQEEAERLRRLILDLVNSVAVKDSTIECSLGFRGSGALYIRSELHTIVAIHNLSSADTPLIRSQAKLILSLTAQSQSSSPTSNQSQSDPRVLPVSGNENHLTKPVIDHSKNNLNSEHAFPSRNHSSEVLPTRNSSSESSDFQSIRSRPEPGNDNHVFKPVIDQSKSPKASLSPNIPNGNNRRSTEEQGKLRHEEPENAAPPQKGMMLRKKKSAETKRTSMPWMEFETELQTILSKVMGDAQASQMITRHLSNYEIDKADEFQIEHLLQFGTEILDRIPNKLKRETLLNELSLLLK